MSSSSSSVGRWTLNVGRWTLAATAALLLFSSCAHHQSPLTIAPHSVVSTSASFDANTRNSGLISSDATGFLVTQHFIERHQVNTTDSGVRAEGNNYRITAQVMARCIEFDRLRKNSQK